MSNNDALQITHAAGDFHRGATRLRPLLGTATALLIGTGVAIGSGIFRTPGYVAQHAPTPVWILAAWLFGGLFFLLAGLVVAELSTRFPDAGGEYVYLHHAYGHFVAFFFGWAYTVFIIGGGVAVMAVGLGEFSCEAIGWHNDSLAAAGIIDIRPAGVLGAAAVVIITAINLVGLRTGATMQNVLTMAKVLALLGVVVVACFTGRAIAWGFGGGAAVNSAGTDPGAAGIRAMWTAFAGALMPVMWCFEGTTDSVKMTEEIRDPRRAMPRALIGTALLVTVVYLLVNWAFLRVLSPAEMAASDFVAADVLGRWLGDAGRRITLVLSMVVVLGAISSTIVSCVRVPFALGRDGMTFRFIGRMSQNQSPIGALLVAAGFTVLFTLTGAYKNVLSVYTISAGVLFGLVNLSLLVFRLRDRRAANAVRRAAEARPTPLRDRQSAAGEADHFRCPAGMAVSVFLALVQFAVAAGTARAEPILAAYTLVVLVVIAAIYTIWPQPRSAAVAQRP